MFYRWLQRQYNFIQFRKFKELIEKREEAFSFHNSYRFESFASVKITLEIAGHAAGWRMMIAR